MKYLIVPTDHAKKQMNYRQIQLPKYFDTDIVEDISQQKEMRKFPMYRMRAVVFGKPMNVKVIVALDEKEKTATIITVMIVTAEVRKAWENKEIVIPKHLFIYDDFKRVLYAQNKHGRLNV